MELKEGAQVILQKRQPFTIHLQEQVANELKRLIENGYLERMSEIREHCFESSVVITVKRKSNEKYNRLRNTQRSKKKQADAVSKAQK